MSYRINIDGHEYQVEVGALDQTPVNVTVDGQPFQVWVESDSAAGLLAETVPHAPERVESNVSTQERMPDSKRVVAPIPGVILSVAVKPGERVEYGQELFVLEAMKMKSSIRALRAGQVGTIHVAAGQPVKHHTVLLEFAD